MENYIAPERPNSSSKILLMIIVILALVIGSLAGCRTPEKMLRKHDAIEAKCRGRELDTVKYHWCMVNAPVKVAKGKTVYLPGKPVTKYEYDTVQVDCDTVHDMKLVRIPCPPRVQVVQVDTFMVHDTLEDSRQVKLLEARYMGAMDLASKEKLAAGRSDAKADVYRKWCMGMGGSLLLLIIFFIAGLMGKGMNPLKWFVK